VIFKTLVAAVSEMNTLVAVLQVVDDLDAVLDRFQRQTYRKALLFVDNAGADVLLGMLPFARQLVKMGTQVRRGH
jgi:prolyl-tRNA editing enzyme YbaK/EbsC (Cys-tRNA(Pro) deacylase)